MKRILIILAITVMTANLFSQEMPLMDKINSKAGTIEIYFIGHGSLMFRVNDYVIYVDPVKSAGSYAGLPKADLILVTHEHGDHLDPALISDLRKESTRMFCNANSAKSVAWAQVMKPGDNIKAGEYTVEAVYAYNIKNERAPGQPFHAKGDGNGYIVTIGDKRIYVAGDTENTPEMKALKNIDVAFLPMNLPYTMTPEMVADAAKAFKPAILYPYHYGNTNTESIITLLKGTGIDVRIRNLK
jgi:L-ascorbate metabolism protein UlaG (beta-lactamase superfamily)